MSAENFAKGAQGFSDLVGGLQGVFGSSVSGSSSTSGTQTTDLTESSEVLAVLEGIRELVATQSTSEVSNQSTSGTTAETQNVAALDSVALETIRNVVSNLEGQATGDIPSNLDFDAIRDAAVAKVIEEGIANVAGINAAAGTSTNSATAEAATKLGARAAQEGATTEASLRLQDQQQVLDSLSQLLQVQKGAQIATTTSGSNDQNTTTNSQSTTDSSSTETQQQEQTQSSTRELDSTVQTDTTTNTKQEDGGLIGAIGSTFGF